MTLDDLLAPERLSLRFTPGAVAIEPLAEFWGELEQPRVGVMLHYDGSASDAGGLRWLKSREVRASYNLVVFDNGSWGVLAPLDRRAWHAGVCRPSKPDVLPYADANSAFYGIAILNGGREDVRPRQLLTAAWLTARLFRRHEWDTIRDGYRVVGHSSEAWKRGRKTDPEGADPDNPILSPADIRELLPLFVDVEAL